MPLAWTARRRSSSEVPRKCCGPARCGRRVDGRGGESRGAIVRSQRNADRPTKAILMAVTVPPRPSCPRKSPGTDRTWIDPTTRWYDPESMKNSRILLILLMALILPVKGAMAAAGMFCHSGSTSSHDARTSEHHAVDHGQSHHHHHGDGNEPSEPRTGDGMPSPTLASCTVCSAVCSSPPLPAAPIVLLSPPSTAGESFPPVAVPRTSAVIGGLERPPRTI